MECVERLSLEGGKSDSSSHPMTMKWKKKIEKKKRSPGHHSFGFVLLNQVFTLLNQFPYDEPFPYLEFEPTWYNTTEAKIKFSTPTWNTWNLLKGLREVYANMMWSDKFYFTVSKNSLRWLKKCKEKLH